VAFRAKRFHEHAMDQRARIWDFTADGIRSLRQVLVRQWEVPYFIADARAEAAQAATGHEDLEVKRLEAGDLRAVSRRKLLCCVYETDVTTAVD
jgi:hypothetical protein